MDLVVLDTNLNSIAVVDVYESLLWNDRYSEAGDFELYMLADGAAVATFAQDYYLVNPKSEHVMFIEGIEVETDIENGDHLKITGNSIETILSRRVVWGIRNLSGKLEDVIEGLLNESIINPEDPKRKIPNFRFQPSYNSDIQSMYIEAQYTGETLYDIVTNICQEVGLGFKITLDLPIKQFVFTLYKGTDYSFNQTENPFIIFSPAYDNLISSDYTNSVANTKNVTLIGGEGEGEERVFTAIGEAEGVARREVFTDAGSVSSAMNEDCSELFKWEYPGEVYDALRHDFVQNAWFDSGIADVGNFRGRTITITVPAYSPVYRDVIFSGNNILDPEDQSVIDPEENVIYRDVNTKECKQYTGEVRHTFSYSWYDKVTQIVTGYAADDGNFYFDKELTQKAEIWDDYVYKSLGSVSVLYPGQVHTDPGYSTVQTKTQWELVPNKTEENSDDSGIEENSLSHSASGGDSNSDPMDLPSYVVPDGLYATHHTEQVTTTSRQDANAVLGSFDGFDFYDTNGKRISGDTGSIYVERSTDGASKDRVYKYNQETETWYEHEWKTVRWPQFSVVAINENKKYMTTLLDWDMESCSSNQGEFQEREIFIPEDCLYIYTSKFNMKSFEDEVFYGNPYEDWKAFWSRMSDEEYDTLLKEKGAEELLNYLTEQSFDSEVDSTIMFKYLEDFFVGDIVEFTNQYGIEAAVRVTETIMSENSEGLSIHPTFEVIDYTTS